MDQKDSKKLNENLFSEFPPISTEEWKQKIEKDLKGADFEKKLVWRTIEGFKTQPYYRSEDIESLATKDSLPGEYPFVRGDKVKQNDWFIRQDIRIDDAKAANKKALGILMRGIDSLGFVLCGKEISKEEFSQLLEGISLESIETNFSGCKESVKILELLTALIAERKENPASVKGAIEFDPMKLFALKGKFDKGMEAAFATAKELIEKSRDLPVFRTLMVDGSIFHNSGSDISQELAFNLAAGVEYLSKLNEAGLEAAEISKNLKFNFAVGSNYFMEIAKLRAARMLWAKIVKAYGTADEKACQMEIHSVNSSWNKTLFDPYVNMLRTTTEAMSASLAGTNSMTVLPFNAIYEQPTEFSERIARNQQLLLKEESHFNKVVDPAAGSYYIETLTDQIAESAWKLFLEVEDKGGYLAALKEGFIQACIKETANTRDHNIATRRQVILGSNQYPNITETIQKEVEESILKPMDCSADDAEIETLKPYRGAIAFEKMRLATEKFAKENHRPKAFMLTMGNLAMRRARAQFSTNFFGCAGFEIIDNNGFKTVDDALEAARAKKADALVICSSDDEYAEIAPEIIEKAGSEFLLVLAGYPKELAESLQEKGLKHMIHVKSNVLETLIAFQRELNIID